MKALLKKDWLTLRGLTKNYLVFIAIYAMVAYLNDNIYLFAGFIIMIPVLMVINSSGYDEKAHMERWMLASGISRKQIALSKYLFAMILLAVMTLVNFCVASFVEELVSALLISLLFALVGMAYVSLILPAVFYFGSEKARIYMMAGFIVPFVAGFGIFHLFQFLGIPLNDMLILGLIVFVCLIVIAVSIFLSIHIVEKKDY